MVLLTGRPLSCLAAAFGSGAARRSSARSPFPFVRYASLEHPRSSGSTLSACLGTTWSHQFQRYLLPPARNITLTCATAAVTQEPNEEQHESSEAQPPVEYCVVNFYHLVDIPRPRELVKQHAAFLEGRDVRGRIYISEQGVNAQYGGVREDAVAYAKWLAETQPLFQGLRYSVYDADDHMFPKLRLKYKPNLISLAGGMSTIPVTQPSARATPVEPSQWKQMLAEGINGQRPLVLDVRNSYEWDAGHFVGAKRPLEDEFNETPTEATPCEVPDYLEAAGPDTPVMMYCTGGIRCDVYSAYLKRKGYNKLYTLEGGIQNYMSQEGLEHWKGSLFVFDGRMAIRKDRDRDAPLEAAVPCQVCQGEAVLPHANCANIDCNQLFIACNTCMTELKGCCCQQCMDAPRLLRPIKSKGQYGNWTEYVSSDEEAAQAMAAGRGEGRISRRRKRQQALKDRSAIKRAEKVERRRRGKEMMASLSREADGPEQPEAEDRMARLRQLKERLASAVKA